MSFGPLKAAYLVVAGVGYTSIGVHLEMQALLAQQR